MLGRFYLLLFLVFLLPSCSDQIEELKNVGKPPIMEKLAAPMYKDGYEPIRWKQEDEEDGKKYANSLWQQGSSSFFKDRKARKIGDILTVTVKVKDKAELKNETKRDRSNSDSAAAPKLFGLENKWLGIIPAGVADPSNLLSTSGKTNSNGKGEIKRDETIETNIAAMVTQILPNGNLVVHGDQEIRVNAELRKVTVDGIVRPEDISAANTVDSEQIAEARISYGGKGQLTNIQQPRVGNQIMEILSPF